jgi:diguanylate cyclase (GGDEF)-like protein
MSRRASASPTTEPQAPWWMFDLHLQSPALRRYILGVVIAGLLVVAVCVGMAVVDDRRIGVEFVTMTALYLVAQILPPIQLNRGGERITYRFAELPTLLGIAIGPAYLVPLAALLGDSIDNGRDMYVLGKRNERFKVLFNIGHVSIQTASTAIIANIGSPIAFIPAAMITSVLSDVLIYRAIEKTGGPLMRESMRTGWDTRLGISAFVATIAAIAVWLVPTGDTKFVYIAVPMAMLVVYKGAAEWLAMGRDRDAWQQFTKISAKLVGTYDEGEIIRTSLVGALNLFGVVRAEITMYGTSGDGFAYSLISKRGQQIHATPVSSADLATIEEQNSVEGDTATTVVPMFTPRGRIGHFTLQFNKSTRRLDARVRLASAFADAVASNLTNARAVEHTRKEAQARAHEASHDSLTGLGNRAMLYTRGPLAMAESAEAGKACALLLFDLDGFKRVNDTLGHAAGDRMLVEVAKRLKAQVRHDDLAVRLGGDEFAVLATGMTAAHDAMRVAEKVLAELVPTIEIEGLHLTIEASIGVAIAGVDAEDVETLLRLADVAMYEAKSQGRGHAVRYMASSNNNSAEQLSLTTDLRAALERDELVMWYQPQVEVATGKILGMEALVRWQHPDKGMLFPDTFVPIAEHSGLIGRFTTEVIRQSVRDHAVLRQQAPGTTMSVNLSARNLMDQGLPDEVADILREHGVPAKELVIEITETFSVGATASVDRVLRALSALGCEISLDDFGTGYSSLSALRENSLVNEIKIDRSFVMDVLTKRDSAVMVRCIVDMAHARGCRVVAEGVEDADVLDALRGIGCDVAQGYHIARPAGLTKVQAWITEWNTSTALLTAALGPETDEDARSDSSVG